MGRKVLIVIDEACWKDVPPPARAGLIRQSELVVVGEHGLWRVEKAANANHPDHVTPDRLGDIVKTIPPGG